MSKYSPLEQYRELAEALADAMNQVLDDMGKTGQSVCLYTKAKARIAWEPFRDHTADEYIMTLEDAQEIIKEHQ